MNARLCEDDCLGKRDHRRRAFASAPHESPPFSDVATASLSLASRAATLEGIDARPAVPPQATRSEQAQAIAATPKPRILVKPIADAAGFRRLHAATGSGARIA